eukprot:TRINITY_DN27325_c1_g1_i2.p1 TRINITY_DN27325_c1_g1~~TRINITY_DN27325_c1_g1_i2.p1  ORF type:complete len:185 (+),score=6.97 TRINITY_DN27325_c1_g1_i2:43-597(+)
MGIWDWDILEPRTPTSDLFRFCQGMEETLTSSKSASNLFHWGGTCFALFLLILNRVKRRSHIQTSLLVAYLFSSLPPVLFNVLRSQFGAWVAFCAVLAHLFWPRSFPVSRFLFFVITPNLLVHTLRSSIVASIFCLIIGAFLVVDHIRGSGGCGNCLYESCSLPYILGLPFLLVFPILYLSLMH